MEIKFSPPDITEDEIQEVADTLRSGWITTGPKTKKFEREIADYCRTSRAVCLSSATACMEMTLRIMGVGPGDEVITTAYTYTATCSVIYHVGATPVLVDVLPGSYEMDPEQVRRAVTEKTKAVIAVDLAGIVYSYYETLFQIAEEKKNIFKPVNNRQKAMGRIFILADAAHAFGARYQERMCGEIADFTCFSFHAVKNLTTAEGGAVVWKDKECIDSDELYKEYMLLSLHGQSKDALEKTKAGAWEYDIIAPYYKCNMTDIMASIGLAQLRRYEGILNRRREIVERYNDALRDCEVEVLSHYTEDSQSSGHLYLMHLKGKKREECNQIMERLAEKGIAVNVHYKPLPMFNAYKERGFDIREFPNAYAQFESEITLPLHTCLTDEEVSYIIKNLKELLKERTLC